MKKILLLIIVALSFGACSWFEDDKDKKPFQPSETETSILAFKGLYPQDSGVGIARKTIDMGKRMMTVSYNEKFSYFDSTMEDSNDQYIYNWLKDFYQVDNSAKFLAMKDGNYTTSIMFREEGGVELTKKALYDKEALKELKDKLALHLALDYKYDFRTTIQGKDAILFKLHSNLNNFDSYLALILEDSEKQMVVWAVTKDSSKMVDFEKTMSTLHIY